MNRWLIAFQAVAVIVGVIVGYGSNTAAKEVAPQIVAKSPNDRSDIAIKDAPMSARSSEAGFSSGWAGSLQSFAE